MRRTVEPLPPTPVYQLVLVAGSLSYFIISLFS